jgi:hypothetical protein
LLVVATQTIVPRMSENTAAAGWVVQLTIPGVPKVPVEGAKWRPAETTNPTFEFFNVAIGSAEKAVEAARKKAGASEEATLRAVRSLSSTEIDSIKLRAGEAKPA